MFALAGRRACVWTGAGPLVVDSGAVVLGGAGVGDPMGSGAVERR